jgi:hypothetical protein
MVSAYSQLRGRGRGAAARFFFVASAGPAVPAAPGSDIDGGIGGGCRGDRIGGHIG